MNIAQIDHEDEVSDAEPEEAKLEAAITFKQRRFNAQYHHGFT